MQSQSPRLFMNEIGFRVSHARLQCLSPSKSSQCGHVCSGWIGSWCWSNASFLLRKNEMWFCLLIFVCYCVTVTPYSFYMWDCVDFVVVGFVPFVFSTC